MYFCCPLRNYFAEADIVYQQALSSNAHSDLSIPSQQRKNNIRGFSSVAHVSVTCRAIKKKI